jgi:hypothetical protein
MSDGFGVVCYLVNDKLLRDVGNIGTSLRRYLSKDQEKVKEITTGTSGKQLSNKRELQTKGEKVPL